MRYVSITALAAAAVSAGAAISFQSPTYRTVFVHSNFDNGFLDYIDTGDLGEFDASVGLSGGHASQLSVIEDGFISFAGEVERFASTQYTPDSANSITTITFDIDTLTDASLSGVIDGLITPPDAGFPHPRITSSIKLSSETETLEEWISDDEPIELDQTIRLAPGRYTLDIRVSGNSLMAVGDRGTAELIVNFVEACVPDLNPDGILDLADISAFVSAFTAQQPAADLHPDGVYDLADIQAFVTAFAAGCP